MVDAVKELIGDEAFSEAEGEFKDFMVERALRDLDNSERLEAMLQGLDEDILHLEVGNVKVPIQRALNKSQRKQLLSIQSDEDGYKLLASICKEAPENSPLYWETLDEATGRVPEMAGRILLMMDREMKAVTTFRKE